MHATLPRILRETGAAIWIGGQLFAVVALPRAAAAIPRARDRRRIIHAGWNAWTPIALGAMGMAFAGTLLERDSSWLPSQRRRAKIRLASAALGLVSTTTATLLGRYLKKHRNEPTMTRDASGYPVALAPDRRLENAMVPLNVAHALSAAGLIWGDA